MELYVLETEGDYNGQFEGGRVNLFPSDEARQACMAMYDLVACTDEVDGNCVTYTIAI